MRTAVCGCGIRAGLAWRWWLDGRFVKLVPVLTPSQADGAKAYMFGSTEFVGSACFAVMIAMMMVLVQLGRR